MSREVSVHSAADVVDWHSWWGDVELVEDESGVVHCHLGPVVYVVLADGTTRRYQALTVGDLNGQVAYLGIQIECSPACLNRVECICDRCT